VLCVEVNALLRFYFLDSVESNQFACLGIKINDDRLFSSFGRNEENWGFGSFSHSLRILQGKDILQAIVKGLMKNWQINDVHVSVQSYA